MATGKGNTGSHTGGAAGNTVTVVVSRTVAEQMYFALAKALAGSGPKKKGKGGKGGGKGGKKSDGRGGKSRGGGKTRGGGKSGGGRGRGGKR